MARVIRVLGLHFPYAGRPRDVLRGALIGMILLSAAGAATARSWGYGAYGIDAGGAVGAEVRENVLPQWPLGALLGAAAGAAVGALLIFAAGAAWEERGSAAAIVVVGALAGGFAGFVWADAATTDRSVVMRAEPPSATRPAAANFRAESAEVRLSGTVERHRNVPLFLFLTVAAAAVGALAGRGLMGTWPAGERYEQPAGGAFEVAAPAGPAQPSQPLHPRTGP